MIPVLDRIKAWQRGRIWGVHSVPRQTLFALIFISILMIVIIFKLDRHLSHRSGLRGVKGTSRVEHDDLLPGKCLYSKYTIGKPRVVNMTDDQTSYFVTSGNNYCFLEGTRSIRHDKGCICHSGFFGKWCSFPEALRTASIVVDAIRPRKTPRRLIYATPFNVEFEMLEARAAEVGDIVDMFMVAESSYTGYGDPKPLRLLEKLQSDYLCEIQEKLVHVYLGYFPPDAKKEGYGWLADDLNRDILGTQGLRYQVSGLKNDDLFVYTDTDELPTREALLFFKIHDGFPEPFGFLIHRTVFGFFWEGDNDGRWKIMAGATVGLVSQVFDHKVSKLRNPKVHLTNLKEKIRRYNGQVNPWVLGERGDWFVGWHCSWCTDIERMQIKLVSAINADFPRWGNFPEKRESRYIRGLIKHGRWFDGKTALHPVPKNFPSVAPTHLLKNRNYRHLLNNLYTSDLSV